MELPENAPRGQVVAQFQTKNDEKGYFLHMWFPVDNVPTALFEDLAAEGWRKDPYPGAPPVDGMDDTHFTKQGGGIFGLFLPEEVEPALTGCRAVLERHGVFEAEPYTLTWHDLI